MPGFGWDAAMPAFTFVRVLNISPSLPPPSLPPILTLLQVEKHELKGLLRNLFYFNRLWAAFDDIDTDDDRRIDLGEFKKGLSFVGLELPAAEAEAEFNAMDANGGGVVLFDEFAAWAAKKKCPVDGDVESEYTTSDSRPTH